MSADASARTDPNEATREALKDYLCRPKPGFAVLLAAPWGAGKTHLATTMTRGAAAMDRPLYVSLFGVGDEAGARLAMARAMVGEGADRQERTLQILSGVAEKFSGMKLQLSLADLARFAEQPTTIILDDLERSGMGQPALAGFINELVEHGGKRVILLAHGEKLWPEDGDQKEKIIGLTLPVVADVEGALPVFLAEIREPAQAFLTGEEALIQETFRRANHHNLRALRQVLFDFARIHTVLDEDLRKSTDGMREFLNLYLALALEVKAGVLGRQDLQARGNYWGDREKPVFAQLRAVSAKHDGLSIQYDEGSILSAKLSQHLLLDGKVDADELRAELIASGRFLLPEEEEWQTVWWARRRDPQAVAEAHAKMETRFKAREYRDPGVVLHVFHLRARAVSMGLSDKALSDIETECRAYVEELARAGALDGIDPRKHDSFREYGYRGLGFPSAPPDDRYPENTAFERLYEHMKTVTSNLFDRERKERIADLPELIRKGKNEDVAAELWQNERGREGASRRIPVLSDLDPETLAAAICENSGEKLFLLGMIFKERYAQSGNALDDELTWLPSLVKALESVAEKKRETEPVHAWQIAENILGNLRIALRARKPDES